jgi:transcriptional regulator with GAF, ATPase, and Fis domain
MKEIEMILAKIPEENRQILFNLIAFPDFFSVDWSLERPDMPPSKLFPVIMHLSREKWITPLNDGSGTYEWTKNFPRKEIIAGYIPDFSKYLRRGSEMLLKDGIFKESYLLMIADQLIESGVRASDLEILDKASIYALRNHRMSIFLRIHVAITEFIKNSFLQNKEEPSHDMMQLFLASTERLIELFFFRPEINLDHPVSITYDLAVQLSDRRTITTLALFKGFYYWISLKYDMAVHCFNEAWTLAKELDDEQLMARTKKALVVSFLIEGNVRKALDFYEESLGKREIKIRDGLSLIIAMNVSLAYTQVGMPQRGLGITDIILNEAKLQDNKSFYIYASAAAGMILLEMRELKESRAHFEKAFEFAGSEELPVLEAISGVGLSAIDYLEGNFDEAEKNYNVITKIPRSSWFPILNHYHLLEIGYLLHSMGRAPIDFQAFFELLNRKTMEQLNPIAFTQIQRLNLIHFEPDTPAPVKLHKLLEIENLLIQFGPTLELAKLRVEISSAYLHQNDPISARQYGEAAFAFLNNMGRDTSPFWLKHLVAKDQDQDENQLYNLMMEMGKELILNEKIERLVTNIMTSISKLTGAERTAIFLRSNNSPSAELFASRNYIKENITDDTHRLIESFFSKKNADISQFEISENGIARKVIMTPLKLGSETMGVLYQDSRYFHIEQSRIHLLPALASQIAVLIDRASAYEEIDKLNKRLIQENRYYIMEESGRFGEIIGSSEANLKVQGLIQKVAPTSSTVLIRGETGVGKELVARAIHRESDRKNKAFIKVNCAALPESLIDSELFGHEKGAFTGAIKTKPGRFELAHEGTIFLDEISELPLATQSRLLRILQEKEFQRVGGSRILTSDFRLISASNKNLERALEDNSFRPDLFYRLNVFPIYIPPLRDRVEDIPALAHHFLHHFSSQQNKQFSGIPESEMKKLLEYTWPGNIRELSNVIERAVILGGRQITFPDLRKNTPHDSSDKDFKSLKSLEKDRILKALKQANGKIGGQGGAAALLNMKRTTLMYRMKILGISVEKIPAE